MIWIGPSVPIGIFWYGWTARYAVHWIVPIIGTIFVGLGAVVITASAQLYMMGHVRSARGGISVGGYPPLIRNASGAFLALAANPLYERFGLGWGNSVLGFITIAFMPVPILFYKYGRWLREKFPLML